MSDQQKTDPTSLQKMQRMDREDRAAIRTFLQSIARETGK